MKKETLLTLQDAVVQYGGVRALDGATVTLDEGEIVALMGPNGAGKSTIIKALIGIAPLASGSVRFHEQVLKPIPHEMPKRGIAYVPQGRQVFKNMTVYENLELGGYALANRKDIPANIAEVLSLFSALKEKLHAKAGLLSGGQQQMLTIARALVADPRVLLLDEPSLGLAPKVVQEVFALIADIHRERGIAVLVVEHSIQSVLAIADRAYVLSHGKIALEGNADSIDDAALERIFLMT